MRDTKINGNPNQPFNEKEKEGNPTYFFYPLPYSGRKKIHLTSFYRTCIKVILLTTILEVFN